MRCRVVFSHPDKSTQFYFKDLKETSNGLKPIGCWMLRTYLHNACIFETKQDAQKLCDYLISIGCKAWPIKVYS